MLTMRFSECYLTRVLAFESRYVWSTKDVKGGVSLIDLCGRSPLLYTKGGVRYPSMRCSTRLMPSYIDLWLL